MDDQGRYATSIKAGVEWMVSKVKNGGAYGSTQATILALKAITRYMSGFVDINGSGSFVLEVEGKKAAEF